MQKRNEHAIHILLKIAISPLSLISHTCTKSNILVIGFHVNGSVEALSDHAQTPPGCRDRGGRGVAADMTLPPPTMYFAEVVCFPSRSSMPLVHCHCCIERIQVTYIPGEAEDLQCARISRADRCSWLAEGIACQSANDPIGDPKAVNSVRLGRPLSSNGVHQYLGD